MDHPATPPLKKRLPSAVIKGDHEWITLDHPDHP